MTEQIAVTYVDHMGTDLSVVNAARVSFQKKSDRFEERDVKLIKYLAEHKHFTPFGHCFASFHIKAPIFVARQLVKHEYLRWNEVSRRYVDAKPELFQPDMWRERAKDKKQGSTYNPVSVRVVENGLYEYDVTEQYNHEILRLYDFLIGRGVCPEQARMVLPQSLMTEWYWSGSLDAFANMCKLRLKEDTQYETRLVAKAVSEQMAGLFPVSWEALLAN
jgi:thymidylate synthase (FAD)